MNVVLSLCVQHGALLICKDHQAYFTEWNFCKATATPLAFLSSSSLSLDFPLLRSPFPTFFFFQCAAAFEVDSLLCEKSDTSTYFEEYSGRELEKKRKYWLLTFWRAGVRFGRCVLAIKILWSWSFLLGRTDTHDLGSVSVCAGFLLANFRVSCFLLSALVLWSVLWGNYFFRDLECPGMRAEVLKHCALHLNVFTTKNLDVTAFIFFIEFVFEFTCVFWSAFIK